jgi:hypothetical protein
LSVVIWRSAIVAGYVALALTFSFLFGGGLIVLLFFFSLFWRWADEARRRILQRPSST